MNRKVFSIIALVLVILLAVGLFLPSVIYYAAGAASTQSQIDALKSKLEDYQDSRDELQAQIKKVSQEKAQEVANKENIDKNIDIIEGQIATLNELIDTLSTQLEEKNQELLEAQDKADEQYEKLKVRIRATYEEGTVTYLELLFSSSSYTEFLTNMDVLSNILTYDNNLLGELKETVETIQTAKEEIEQAKTDQEQAKTDLQTRQQELEEAYAQSVSAIADLEEDKTAYEEEYDKIEETRKEVQKEIDALIAQQSAKEYVGGEFTWPTPGVTKISCEFGPRIHPITGKNSMHTGIDIAAPYGTKIVAANSGTVIISAYSSVYGNYVVVDHGGGYSTLYAHMSKRVAAKGKTVTKGDLIGYVGSTGWSTGNHLHFEIRLNGEYKNPLDYYTLK